MKKSKGVREVNAFARFSSIGIQMLFFIAGGAYLGKFLDEKLELETPWMTILLSLLGVFVGLYLVLKEVSRLNK